MKTNIAILAGGDSGEYDISIQSAALIKLNLDPQFFTSKIIHIKGKEWTYEAENSLHLNIDKNDFSLTIDGKKEFFDFVYIAIHGTPGENGILQAYFELMRIPYIGSDVLTSALTFNKNYCNRVVRSYGVTTAESVHLFKNEKIKTENILKITGLPCFVKPCNSGSSVGMSKVNKKGELETAIKLAFQHDDQILIEEFIEGREITCGVMKQRDQIFVLPITEIISKKEYFDYEAKYTKGMADEITPAEIDEEVAKRCREISGYLYTRLNCKGVVRFDYIFNNNGMFFLEVNTIPGQSANSIVPQQAESIGLKIKDLYTMLIGEKIFELENSKK